MAQTECKMKYKYYIYLEMVEGTHPDKDENQSESGLSQCVGTAGECEVDGHFQQDERGSFQKDAERTVLIQSLRQATISLLNIKPTRRAACMSITTSVDTTIYYYKSNMVDDLGKGIPVVLNISDSNSFLKCTFINNRAVLAVECMEKDELNSIPKNDPTKWPFVFYLSCTKDNCRRFESAQCAGWFIRTESRSVCMDEQKDKDKDSEKFSFIFSSSPNTTKSK